MAQHFPICFPMIFHETVLGPSQSLQNNDEWTIVCENCLKPSLVARPLMARRGVNVHGIRSFLQVSWLHDRGHWPLQS